MEFYALPGELVKWLNTVISDNSNWIVRWDVPPNMYSRLSATSRSVESWDIGEGTGPDLFIGSTTLRPQPVMIRESERPEQMDFLNSLCVRLVPSFILRDTLLEGRIESFPLTKYRPLSKGPEFVTWRKAILSSLKREVFSSPAAATQRLQNGDIKRWDKVPVSQGAIDWFGGGGKLKQFADGPVELIHRLLRYS